MEALHFLRPAWLLLLPLVAVLIVLLARVGDATRAWRRWVSPHLLDALWVQSKSQSRVRPLGLLGVILTLSIVALAGPAWQQQPAPFTQDTASLVILLKVTPSMLTRDVQPSRLARAKHKIHDILQQRAGAKTALVAYAGSAHLVMPLTRDPSVLETFAADLHPDLMPRPGDVLADALKLAAGQLEAAGEKGSILWIGDEIPSETLAENDVGSGASLVLLGVLGANEGDSGQDRLKRRAADLDARLVLVTSNQQDVEQVMQSIEKAFSGAAADEEGLRWRDDGYWLVIPIMVLALFWFRPGWVVRV